MSNYLSKGGKVPDIKPMNKMALADFSKIKRNLLTDKSHMPKPADDIKWEGRAILHLKKCANKMQMGEKLMKLNEEKVKMERKHDIMSNLPRGKHESGLGKRSANQKHMPVLEYNVQ